MEMIQYWVVVVVVRVRTFISENGGMGETENNDLSGWIVYIWHLLFAEKV
jgi:hypothetical protein